jgi:transcription antitermination factor NusG
MNDIMSSVSHHPKADPPILPWFALRVRPNFEKTVAMSLRNKGYEEFLPLYQARRRWSDRYRTLELPLFSGYLFCRIDLRHRLPVLTTPGLLGIVSSGKIPLPVNDVEVAAVQSVVRSNLAAQPLSGLAVGERVRIEAGPLRGVEGVLLRMESSYRLIVSVTLLHRSVSVKVERNWVYPLAWEAHPVMPAYTTPSPPTAPGHS